jgi:hypothetical protein
VALLTGLASQEERWLALQVLQSADDDELGDIFDRDGTLLAVLEEGIPDGDALRPELESFFGQRFSGGRDVIAGGQVAPQRQPADTFTPALLDRSLADLDLVAEPTSAELSRITKIIARWSADSPVATELLTMSRVQRSRAARWLTMVRVLAHQDPGSPQEALTALDNVLDRLYRAAALDVPDANRLRELTIRPAAAQTLRRALDPLWRGSADSSGGPAPSFTDVVPGQPGDFATRLRAAYDDDIRAYFRGYGAGARRAERGVPGSWYSMEHIGQIGLAAQRWTDGTFGAFARSAALVPDRPGIRGNIHDQYASRDREIETMTPAKRRALAGWCLRNYLSWHAGDAGVLWEHHAAPEFDEQREPLNKEARIISAVIDCLLDDEDILAQVLETYRAHPGEANPLAQDIWVQVFRAPEPWRNQHALWDIAGILVHEYLHLLEHPHYQSYRSTLGFGTHAYNTLVEGVVSLLTEVVWSGVLPTAGDLDVRRVIEGEYASQPALALGRLPHPADRRYASMAEVMRLLHVVGNIRNLYAAFFLGEVELITGPISLAVMGSPRAPLSAGEVAAVVARLNAMPAAERQWLRISLFSDASQQEIERLLTQRGADVLTVWGWG